MATQKDVYRDFAHLASEEREGVDYRIVARRRDPRVAVIAPHGGGIEPGTSEIAEGIAGSRCSLYCFEGLKKKNGVLHITSARFDEPTCVKMLAQAERVLAVHGCQDPRQVVFVRGCDSELARRLREALGAAGFTCEPGKPGMSGESPADLCNRGATRQGCQIEITKELRLQMFSGLDVQGRQSTTSTFVDFVQAAEGALLQGLEPPDSPATEDKPGRVLSEVAMWHLLSGAPDNVTEDGEFIKADASLRLRAEKELLRAAIEELRSAQRPEAVRSLARLAASYLLAGDMETAARYVTKARDRMAE